MCSQFYSEQSKFIQKSLDTAQLKNLPELAVC